MCLPDLDRGLRLRWDRDCGLRVYVCVCVCVHHNFNNLSLQRIQNQLLLREYLSTYTVDRNVLGQNTNMESRSSRNSRTLRSERQRIVRMWLGGSSARVISHATGISVSTVHRWVRRWREEGTVETRPYSYTRHRPNLPPPYPYTRWTPTANIFDNNFRSVPFCYLVRT